jgi:hypothetical protein
MSVSLIELGYSLQHPSLVPFVQLNQLPYDSQVSCTSLWLQYRVQIPVEDGVIVSDAVCFGMPKSVAGFLKKTRLTLRCVCPRSVMHTFHYAAMRSTYMQYKLSFCDALISKYNITCWKLQKTKNTKLNSVAVVRKRTIPTERPPLVDEVSANLCG